MEMIDTTGQAVGPEVVGEVDGLETAGDDVDAVGDGTVGDNVGI
jgi:hypothetical protein